MNSNLQSVSIFSYKDLSDTNYRFLVENHDGSFIEFDQKDITQIRNNYEKGYYIIEGKFNDSNSNKIKVLANWNLKFNSKINRQVTLKWRAGDNIQREVEFLGQCTFYKEHFDIDGSMYFELIVQDTRYINNNTCIFSVGDCYVHAEIEPRSIKNISSGDAFWSATGIALGATAVIGGVPIMVAGGAGALVTLNVFFGVNTIIACTYDLGVIYNGDENKVGDLNYIRDVIFGGVAELVDISQKIITKENIDENKKKSIKYSAYHVSEIILASTGIKALLGKIRNGNKIGVYVRSSKIKNLNKGLNGRFPMVNREIMWHRMGYDFYQFSNTIKTTKGYITEIGHEINKTISPMSSGIEVMR